jgi:hypothetical protein
MSQEIIMDQKVENFRKELRAKLDGVEKRLKELNATTKNVTEKTRSEVKAQLAALDSRAKAQRAKQQEVEAKAKTWLERKKVDTSEKIATWKAQHEVNKLTAHAKDAEDYAAAAMQLAIAAVDESERAAVEAVVARLDADAAQGSPAKNA